MTLQEKIVVMQAAQRGEQIQVRNNQSRSADRLRSEGWTVFDRWTDAVEPKWDNRESFCFYAYEYRVKSHLREFWMNVYPDGVFGAIYCTKLAAEKAASYDGKPTLFREVESTHE